MTITHLRWNIVEAGGPGRGCATWANGGRGDDVRAIVVGIATLELNDRTSGCDRRPSEHQRQALSRRELRSTSDVFCSQDRARSRLLCRCGDMPRNADFLRI